MARTRRERTTRGRSSRWPGARAQVLALARQETLDGLRGRRQLALRAVTPILLFGVVLVATLVTRGPETIRTSPYRVAVEGMDGAGDTLAKISNDRLQFEPSTDAALDASRRADLGLSFPDRFDELRAAGSPVEVAVFEQAASAPSRSATAIVKAGFGELHRSDVSAALGRDAGGTPLGAHLSLEVTNVQRTEAGTRVLSAELIPALLLLQAALLVSGTATRLLGRRNRGLLVSHLLLPMSRWRMTLAKMSAELATGLLAGTPVLLALLAYVAITSLGRGGIGAMALDTGATLMVALALAVPMAAVGLLIGTISKSQEQVSLATAIAIVVAAAMAALVALGERPPPSPNALIPVAGLAGELRRTLSGDPSPFWMLVALAATAAFSAATVRFAARRFDAERLVLRSSS